MTANEPGLRMLRSLRHRNFRLFVGGQLISLAGTWMQSVAQAWLVYRLTGSSLLLGTIAFAGQVPIFLLATAGGSVADRFERRKVVMATQVASMLLAILLTVITGLRVVEVWHLMVLAALLGIVNAFDIPARQSFLLEMVTREDLPNAIALNSSVFNGARIAGPAAAGLLVGLVGEFWCFALNAVSYLAVIGGLLAMRLPAREPIAAADRGHVFEGFGYAASTPPVRSILVALAVVSIFGAPYTVLLPVFAGEILHGGASALGVLMASTGLGALTGALLLAARTGFRGMGRMIAWAAGGFGLSLIGFAWSRNMALSAVLLYPVGLCLMLQMACSNTLVQAMTPDRLRGRVMAVYATVFLGVAPFGALLAGWAASLLGAPAVVAAGGAVSAIAGVWFGRVLPDLRGQARELIRAQQAVPEEYQAGR